MFLVFSLPQKGKRFDHRSLTFSLQNVHSLNRKLVVSLPKQWVKLQMRWQLSSLRYSNKQSFKHSGSTVSYLSSLVDFHILAMKNHTTTPPHTPQGIIPQLGTQETAFSFIYQIIHLIVIPSLEKTESRTRIDANSCIVLMDSLAIAWMHGWDTQLYLISISHEMNHNDQLSWWHNFKLFLWPFEPLCFARQKKPTASFSTNLLLIGACILSQSKEKLLIHFLVCEFL